MRRPALLVALLLGLAGVGATEARPMPPTTPPGLASSDPVIQSASLGHAQRMARLVDRCDGDHARFTEVILGDRGLWSKQREVCRSIRDYPLTLVPAGNSVGKSYVAARVVLSFLYQHRPSIVFTTSPTQGQLDGILWKEIRSAIDGSRIPLGAKVRGSSPIVLQLAEKWKAIGHCTTKIESATGHHGEHLLALVDEASGVSDDTFAGLWSLNPSRKVLFGNPLHPHGRFYELCKIAEREAEAEKAGGPPRTSNIVKIPSTMSPHIDMDRSPVGMADRGFLAECRRDYGEDSLWWISHILAEFPDVTMETLIPPAWFKLACETLHVAAGHRRIAIDVAEGGGGDNWVILCRDDNGLLDLKWDNNWKEEDAAGVVVAMVRDFGVHPARITWDAGGAGQSFGNRLAARGLAGARPYKGGFAAKEGSPNLRSACGKLARFRLDPGRQVQVGGVYRPQAPFSLRPGRPEWHEKLREMTTILRFLEGDDYQVELSKDVRARLKRSPDFADAFFQSFMFGD